jgi:pyrroloquinoline quinone (PQQ) biosynthesis protein C
MIQRTQLMAATLRDENFHRQLAQLNAGRLCPRLGAQDVEVELQAEFSLRQMEAHYVEAERAAIAPMLAAVPTEPVSFMAWFEGLKQHGPGQHDALFPWLAKRATMPQMRWFLTQEVAGEAGFDDLVAMTQLRMPTQVKIELARNYWDEMGRGREDGMHGPMLDAIVRELGLKPAIDDSVGEALALANMMLALASSRRYAYQSVGALGAVELTAPSRVSLVNEGLRRLGVSPRGRRYFQLHAGLDVRHSESWNREVILPLISSEPQTARLIAEGALLRLRCGERCFQRYRKELGVGVAASSRYDRAA